MNVIKIILITSVVLLGIGVGDHYASTYSEAIAAGFKEDISFQAPLFCENERKSIVYANFAAKKFSFSWLTRLAFFTDEYPNAPAAYLFSSVDYRIEGNKIFIDFYSMDRYAKNVKKWNLVESGELAVCEITLDEKWRTELRPKFPELKDSVIMYETSEFEVACNFGSIEEKKCSYSSELAKKLTINSPYDAKKLPFRAELTFKLID